MGWQGRFERRRGRWLTGLLAIVAIASLASLVQPFLVIFLPSVVATVLAVAFELVRPYPKKGALDRAFAWTVRVLGAGSLVVAMGWLTVAVLKPGPGGLAFGTAEDERQFLTFVVAMVTPAAVSIGATVAGIVHRRGGGMDRNLIWSVLWGMVVFSLGTWTLTATDATPSAMAAVLAVSTILVTLLAAVVVAFVRLYHPKPGHGGSGAERPATDPEPWAQLRRV